MDKQLHKNNDGFVEVIYKKKAKKRTFTNQFPPEEIIPKYKELRSLVEQALIKRNGQINVVRANRFDDKPLDLPEASKRKKNAQQEVKLFTESRPLKDKKNVIKARSVSREIEEDDDIEIDYRSGPSDYPRKRGRSLRRHQSRASERDQSYGSERKCVQTRGAGGVVPVNRLSPTLRRRYLKVKKPVAQKEQILKFHSGQRVKFCLTYNFSESEITGMSKKDKKNKVESTIDDIRQSIKRLQIEAYESVKHSNAVYSGFVDLANKGLWNKFPGNLYIKQVCVIIRQRKFIIDSIEALKK